jgi:hypothetical protein
MSFLSQAVTKGLNPNVPMKDSGVEWLGKVPAHWGMTKLKHLVAESVAGPYGASLTKDMYTSSGYRVYGQQQVIPDDFTVGDYYISEAKFDEMRRYSVYKGDVLVSVMGTIGKVAVVPGDVEPGIINPRLVRYRCSECIRPRYLQRVLLSQKHQEHLLFEAKGTTMDGLNIAPRRPHLRRRHRQDRRARPGAATRGRRRMSIHKEIHLEDEICADLTAAGWLYDAGDAGRYDRTQALFVDDAVAWIKASQPKAWEAIEKSHGAAAPKVVAERLRKSLDSQGTLAVLRQGFEMIGLKHAVAMCQFKPALAMNADLQAKYAANRLRVVRQVHYSVHHENSIDLVLFVNGIPVATAELKSHYTQGVQDAVYQYKTDREPFFKPKNVAEPLLAFPGGALVHFAVSNAAAEMTTRLAGLDTTFLPFNQGNAGGAGNPPKAGIATDYLWKEVWQRDSFLQILGRYLVPVKNAKKQLVGWIFPRYHQLTVTRKLVAAVTLEGPGNKYLVQHSAGSGKTNSIAWTAHFLADLHDAKDQKVFDTVIVISDRTVLDDQLREAIMSFERTQGVVAVITGEGASKSKELAEALSAGKKIVVCTVQTFPFALEEVRKLAATKGKRFAVIVDEAHSSQTNETAAKLKMVLSAAEMAELIDGGGVSAEDILAAQMAAKAGDDEKAGITYVAFTATPKDKTLQLFGTRPDPTRKPAPDNIPAPFHVYSMRQAIEEGFILDVLKTYTSYKVAFSLAHQGQGHRVQGGRQVRGHEGHHGLGAAARVQHRAARAGGGRALPQARGRPAGRQAKAMVVTGSRKEAVRWQKATRKYIADHGYKIEHAGRLLRRGDRPGQRARPVHRAQQGVEPEAGRAGHPHRVQGWRLPAAAGGQQVPDRLRRAAAVRDVRRQAAGRHPGRADAVAPEPLLPRQGPDLRGRLRQRPGRHPGRVQALFRDG